MGGSTTMPFFFFFVNNKQEVVSYQLLGIIFLLAELIGTLVHQYIIIIMYCNTAAVHV